MVADLKARGVRTLYLGTARYNSTTDILRPQYTRDNVVLSRQYTGLPVHVIGGSGDTVTLAQVAGYARAARETAAAGGSFYDYRTTKPGFWSYLGPLAP